MSPPSPPGRPEGGTETAEGEDTAGGNRPSRVRVTVIVQNRCTFDAEPMTGMQIKEAADIPEGFALYRRMRGGNEPIPDDTSVELRNGDHLFARPPSNVS
jgi:hypothetical protein